MGNEFIFAGCSRALLDEAFLPADRNYVDYGIMIQQVSITHCTVYCSSSAQFANRTCFTLRPIEIIIPSIEKTILLLVFCNHFDMSRDEPGVFMYISKCGVREEM